MDFVCRILSLAVLLVLVWVILSLVANLGRLSWDHPVRKVYNAVDGIMQPVIRPIRSALPPMRMGGMGLDLSPLILIIGIQILQSVICS